MMPELWAGWLIVAVLLMVIARRLGTPDPLRGLWRMIGGATAVHFASIMLLSMGHPPTAVSRLLAVVMAALFATCVIVPASYLGARALVAFKRGGTSTFGAYMLSALLVVVISTVAFTALVIVALATIGFSAPK